MYNQQSRPGNRSPLPATPTPSKLPAFKVVKLTPVGTGTLKAFIDIKIGRGQSAVTVCKWRLIQQDGQTPWLSAPQETWVADSGERRYANLFIYPKEWRDSITAAALVAWDQYKQDGGRNAQL